MSGAPIPITEVPATLEIVRPANPVSESRFWLYFKVDGKSRVAASLSSEAIDLGSDESIKRYMSIPDNQVFLIGESHQHEAPIERATASGTKFSSNRLNASLTTVSLKIIDALRAIIARSQEAANAEAHYLFDDSPPAGFDARFKFQDTRKVGREKVTVDTPYFVTCVTTKEEGETNSKGAVYGSTTMFLNLPGDVYAGASAARNAAFPLVEVYTLTVRNGAVVRDENGRAVLTKMHHKDVKPNSFVYVTVTLAGIYHSNTPAGNKQVQNGIELRKILVLPDEFRTDTRARGVVNDFGGSVVYSEEPAAKAARVEDPIEEFPTED